VKIGIYAEFRIDTALRRLIRPQPQNDSRHPPIADATARIDFASRMEE
jgi:hypothetical protein